MAYGSAAERAGADCWGGAAVVGVATTVDTIQDLGSYVLGRRGGVVLRRGERLPQAGHVERGLSSRKLFGEQVVRCNMIGGCRGWDGGGLARCRGRLFASTYSADLVVGRWVSALKRGKSRREIVVTFAGGMSFASLVRRHSVAE